MLRSVNERGKRTGTCLFKQYDSGPQSMIDAPCKIDNQAEDALKKKR
jgi:hypothetical protein